MIPGAQMAKSPDNSSSFGQNVRDVKPVSMPLLSGIPKMVYKTLKIPKKKNFDNFES